MLELCGMRNTPSLPSLPGPLWLLVGWLFGFYVTSAFCRLFNAKFCLYVYPINLSFLNKFLVGKIFESRISFVCTQGPLGPRVVAPDRVLSMGQIELNCILMLN